MSILRRFRSNFTVTDTQIVVDTVMSDGAEIKSSITRGGSEDTDLQTLLGKHRDSVKVVATSPPITLDAYHRWLVTAASSTVTGGAVKVTVPVDNSGTLLFHVDTGPIVGIPQYSKNGGTWTTFATGTTLVVANTDTLNLRGSAMYKGVVSGSVIDSDTGKTIDTFRFECLVVATALATSTVAPIGVWTIATTTATITTGIGTITVPTGNSGTLRLVKDSTGASGTVKYSKNGGSYTTFTTGDTVVFADTNTLKFQGTSMVTGDVLSGKVIDNDTGTQLDAFNISREAVEREGGGGGF